MSIDISALKVLFKKIFPPTKSIYTVDTNGDGKADSLLIKALNVIMPMEIPKEIELGGFNTKDFNVNTFQLSDYGKLYLDDTPINVSKKDFEIAKLKDHFTFYIRKEKFTIDDLLRGKLAGKIIALGDTINIVIKIDEDSLDKFSEGQHKFKFTSEIIPTLEFNFELGKENLNQSFDTVNN
ncbi:MAG: hypothetical protein EAX91_03520 [Candidatus Lokiarchaeota archaeon]|nr:hypothetical protein [Candidatus Lokiarchaeota archaeon]